MDTFLFSAHIKNGGDSRNVLDITSRQLVITYKGKTQMFDLDKILHLGFARKKLIIPLVGGGIGTTLSMIALSMGWYNYHVNLGLIFLFFGVMYYGFIGSDALEIVEKGQNHVYLLNSIPVHLRDFVKFFLLKRQAYIQQSGQVIYHLAQPEVWHEQTFYPIYQPKEFEREGFIHASEMHQLSATYDRYYAGTAMLILCIDKAFLKADLKYESSEERGEEFPHIYGPINKESIIEILEVKPAQPGTLPNFDG